MCQHSAATALDVRFDGRAVAPSAVSVSRPQTNDVQVELKFLATFATMLAVRSMLVSKLAHGHRQYFVLADEQDHTMSTRLLNANDDRIEVNLAEELGQLAIAGLLLPMIWKLKDRSVYARRVVPTRSLAIVVAGIYWLIKRTLLR